MVVNTSQQPRQYVMKLVVDEACGNASSKNAGKLEDQIQLCASDGPQVKLKVDWFTRDADREFHNKSTLVVARGAAFDIESDGAKLSIRVK